MTALIFPGQGSQFVGMAESFQNDEKAAQLFAEANDILGFDILKIMLEGSEEQLKQTKVTQPAVFLHSVISAMTHQDMPEAAGMAGHSLGEFSALVASGALAFADGVRLVSARAQAMQEACMESPGTMAAIVGLEDEVVERVCASTEGTVVAANYNCPGQLVISGEITAVENACELLKEEGAKRALVLQVGGAFHSPLMASAEERLAEAIQSTDFQQPSCPIYQNVDGKGYQEVNLIKQNLVKQLTSPVRWVSTIQSMIATGMDDYYEVGGNGKVLRGMMRRISREVSCAPLT
ncbi:MAG: ACP S-malonyltransferase [Saprospiraceae bacterium]|nr:ACP S-malonyltransferase [Saprospiraceae bacterium]